jgi:transmembrane sensor
MSSAKEIEKQVARWLLRKEEPDWSDQDQAALNAWLDASPLHRVAFYRLEYGWHRADRLAALKGAATPAGRSRPFLLTYRGAAAAAVLLAVASFGGFLLLHDGRQVSTRTYETEIGVQTNFPLDDGTQVELNTDSELTVALSAKSRSAWLDRGEVFFAVAHDTNRPFFVHAGGHLVTVVGTKFSVRDDGDRVTVAVLEGRVQVEAKSASTLARPGDIVITHADTATIEHRSVDTVAAALSWRQGLLTFDRATLSDVAKEFNRYNHKKLVVDAATAAIHIGGTFDASNVDAFARLLQQAYRLNVVDEGSAIKISGGELSH